MQNSGGGLKFVTAAGSYDIVTSQNKYQVGAVVIRADNVSPASIEGGTWQKIAQGRAIIGASTDYPLNSTGGAKTHNHALGTVANAYNSPAQALIQVNVIDDAPCVAMAVGDISSAEQLDYTPTERTVGMEWQRGNYGTRTSTVPVVGSTQGHSSLQPYVALNIWQKIAD